MIVDLAAPPPSGPSILPMVAPSPADAVHWVQDAPIPAASALSAPNPSAAPSTEHSALGTSPRAPTPATDLLVLRLCERYEWVTPTLCADERLFANRGTASRRLAYLCSLGYLAAHPHHPGHYMAGPACWEMLCGQLRCIARRQETRIGVLERERAALLAIQSGAEQAVHALSHLRMAVDINHDPVTAEDAHD